MVNMIIYKDEVFNFFEIFNEENGTLIRSDVDGIDPEMRSFPEQMCIRDRCIPQQVSPY